MDKIKRFIECVIPVTQCNLKCEYCYVIQRCNNKQKPPKMDYDEITIGKAFKKERWGGICYVNICGQGETLIPEETLKIVYEILKQGHYVNITTNGTLTKRFEQLKTFPEDYLKRLNISFSFHYLELKRLNMTEIFFNNINLVRELGCSFVLQLNLYDRYMPYIDEIKKISMEKVGAYPQIAATRKEINLKNHIEIFTDGTIENYIKQGQKFNSPLFEFTMKNFNVKQKSFCYAGDWSFQLNLADGTLRRCYSSQITQNIFKDVDKPIEFVAMGHACTECFCVNSSHFMSLGIIPAVKTPSYAFLRNRKEAKWYNEQMENFLNSRLYDSNEKYGIRKKIKSYFYHFVEIKIVMIYKLKVAVIKLIRK